MIGGWLTGRRTVEVKCDLDIEQTQESFHAHAIPDGIDIRPGDVVLVHGAPDYVAFGEHIVRTCTATVVRANWFERHWTQLTAIFELTELYEVGFSAKE